MNKGLIDEVVYSPPELELIDVKEIAEKLGPVVSCSGFGGSATGC